MMGRSSSSDYYTEVNILISLTNFISLHLCLSIIAGLSVSSVAMATSRAGAAMRHASHPSRCAHRKREKKVLETGTNGWRALRLLEVNEEIFSGQLQISSAFPTQATFTRQKGKSVTCY